MKHPTLLNLQILDSFGNFEIGRAKQFSPLSAGSQGSFADSTLSSSSNLRPSYYSIIEDNDTYLTSQILAYASNIQNASRDVDDNLIINNYTISDSLGKGQFGKVYKACVLKSHDSSTGKKLVAIKVIGKKPMNNQQYSMNQVLRQLAIWKSKNLINKDHNLTHEQVVMLVNLHKIKYELFVLSKLNKSDNVIKLIEFLDSPHSNKIWIVNQYCDLGELQWKRNHPGDVLPQWRQFLSRSQESLENENVLNVFAEKFTIDMTAGLMYLKDNGCIHRDLKPANVLLDSIEMKFKISDFGCSVIDPAFMFIKDDKENTLQNCFKTEIKKIVGTPAFIAPELCSYYSEDNQVDKSSSAISTNDLEFDHFSIDMWSFGVTLYCILYNELPFFGDNEFDTYKRIAKVELTITHRGDWIEELLINKILVKSPSDRITIDSLYNKLIGVNSNGKLNLDRDTDLKNVDNNNSSIFRSKKETPLKSQKNKVKGLFQNILNFNSIKSNNSQNKFNGKGTIIPKETVTLPTPPQMSFGYGSEPGDDEDLYSSYSSPNMNNFPNRISIEKQLEVLSISSSEASSFGSTLEPPVPMDNYENEMSKIDDNIPGHYPVVSSDRSTPEKALYQISSTSMVELTPTKKIIDEGADYSPGIRQGLSLFNQFSRSEEMLPSTINSTPIQVHTHLAKHKQQAHNVFQSKSKLAHSKNVMNFKDILSGTSEEVRDNNIKQATDKEYLNKSASNKRNTVDAFKEFQNYFKYME
ncbi:hypothetical protein TPHA_0N01450 [Tetrapisispora phaffii CBS 4417]|uniref:Protein kinase domain-containing protein n=1 Tax=Tetrapisispora phaffii (strain ATCC 24235 / CBS 4417 / NBRC 1672 / NRRL Y-8282 / UCD 70-5) TaxID=1071381 RepID=G8C198_TETPH|nr:hypothetical protein TPHA_0N01450 [Tetrapisispora phaffii CBS 4417]CCE65926.1 hypothetical protein TPHA_0N01450 [Tetrapisispora phaffii CBS 4417]